LSKPEAVSPPPDGGFGGGNPAEGQNVLLSLTTGTYNTALQTVVEQQKQIDSLEAELKEQRNLILKISEKLGTTRPAPQMVSDD
jgi:hypothetical protein